MFNATLSESTPTSTVFHASDSVSDYTIEGDFKGSVCLQVKNPLGSYWFNRVIASAPESSPLMTPSSELDYRFILIGSTGSATVSFSPTA